VSRLHKIQQYRLQIALEGGFTVALPLHLR
jgi:hypothetical protein